MYNNLPKEFLDRTHLLFGNKTENVLNSFCTNKPTTFRVNILKTSAEKLITELNDLGIKTRQVDHIPNAFMLENVPQKTLTNTDQYKNGQFYVQGLSSMLPPIILDPKSGEKILDITAAPGSKTTQMAVIMQNKGEIIANDRSKVRLFKLIANLKIQGITNTKTLNLPAQDIGKRYRSYFDKALVDVPCSLEGMFKCGYPKSYNDWSLEKVHKLAFFQKAILESAVSAVKPGGVIVYSTCTLSPEENEEVINWLIEKEGDAIKIEKIELEIDNSIPGIITWQNKIFSNEIGKTLRVIPSKNMEAFYIAKIVKLKSKS